MSRTQIDAYLRPGDLEAAWEALSRGGRAARLLSGGSDLTISLPPAVTTLIDLQDAVPSDIHRAEDGAIHIGAMATLTAILEHPDLADHATGVIPEMMVHVGNPLLRNFSTIGGHLARGRLSDIVPVLLALDAEVTVYRDEGEAVLTLDEYFADGVNQDPHILTWVMLPEIPTTAAAFQRFTRTAFDFPLINLCVRIDGTPDQVTDARIIAGATPYRSQRARAAETWIRDQGLTPEAIEVAANLAADEVLTESGWVASAEYRTHLVGVLVKRCLQTAMRRLEER